MWSFLGILLSTALTAFSVVLTRRASIEIGRAGQRSESYTLLRWAVDLTRSPDGASRRVGLAALDALLGSSLVDRADRQFVAAIGDAAARNTQADHARRYER
jgi:hypothetical protein